MDSPLTLILSSIAAVVVIGSAILSAGIWIGRVNADRCSFAKFMERIDSVIETIQSDIHRIFERLPKVTTKEDSPITLTDLGNTVSREIDAKAWAKMKAVELKDKILEQEDFKLHELSAGYLANDFKPDREFDEKMRKCAYDHGIDDEQIMKVLMVELREALIYMRDCTEQ